MKPVLPEEIFELILSYAPDFHDNLKRCHEELKYKVRIKYSRNKNTSFDVTNKKIMYWNSIGFVGGMIIINTFKYLTAS
jgi:hypothetical protein